MDINQIQKKIEQGIQLTPQEQQYYNQVRAQSAARKANPSVQGLIQNTAAKAGGKYLGQQAGNYVGNMTGSSSLGAGVGSGVTGGLITGLQGGSTEDILRSTGTGLLTGAATKAATNAFGNAAAPIVGAGLSLGQKALNGQDLGVKDFGEAGIGAGTAAIGAEIGSTLGPAGTAAGAVIGGLLVPGMKAATGNESRMKFTPEYASGGREGFNVGEDGVSPAGMMTGSDKTDSKGFAQFQNTYMQTVSDIINSYKDTNPDAYARLSDALQKGNLPLSHASGRALKQSDMNSGMTPQEMAAQDMAYWDNYNEMDERRKLQQKLDDRQRNRENADYRGSSYEREYYSDILNRQPGREGYR